MLGVAIVVLAIGECLYDSVQGPLVAGLAPDGSTGRYLAVSGFGWQIGFILAPALGGVAPAPRRSRSRRSACACASPGRLGRCASSGRCRRPCASRRRLAGWRPSGSSVPGRWGAPSAARCCAAGRGSSRPSPGGASGRRDLRARPGSSCCPGSRRWWRRRTWCSRSSRRRRRVRSRGRLAGARLVADLNAVSPETARGLGVDVDGSISGPPPVAAGTTRIYLSGPRAGEVAALPFDGVEVVVVGDEVGAASAVKMSTASVYKGSVALLTQALRAADHYGVLEHVLADLGEENAGAADRAVGGEGRPLRRRDARDRRRAGRGGARPGAVRGVCAGVGGDRRDAAGGGRARGGRFGPGRGAARSLRERELPEVLDVREADADEA